MGPGGSQMKTYRGIPEGALLALLSDPAELKRLYIETAVLVTVEFQKLHAPAPGSRKSGGHGKTLCGTKGVRAVGVTCKRCLASMKGGG